MVSNKALPSAIPHTASSDPVITPEVFAQTVVEDYALAPSYHTVIVKSIQEQLSDFRSHTVAYSTVEDSDSDDEVAHSTAAIKGELDPDDAQWWEMWRRRVKTIEGSQKRAEEEENNRRRRSASRGKQKVKKEEDDGDVAILADNEEDNEDNEEDSEKVDEDLFKPLNVDDIKVDERVMYEDMRILIKACNLREFLLDIVIPNVLISSISSWARSSWTINLSGI